MSSAAYTTGASLLSLPSEILTVIFKYVNLSQSSHIHLEDASQPEDFIFDSDSPDLIERRAVRDVRLVCKRFAELSLVACATLAQKSLPNSFSVVPIRLNHASIDRLEAVSQHILYKDVVQQLFLLPRDEDLAVCDSGWDLWPQYGYRTLPPETGHRIDIIPGHLASALLDDDLREKLLSIVDANVPTHQDFQEERNRLDFKAMSRFDWDANPSSEADRHEYSEDQSDEDVENPRIESVRIPRVTHQDLRYLTLTNITERALKAIWEACESEDFTYPLLITWVCPRRQRLTWFETLCPFPQQVERLQTALSRLSYFGSLRIDKYWVEDSPSWCVYGSVLSWFLSNITKAKMLLQDDIVSKLKNLSGEKLMLEHLTTDSWLISSHRNLFGGIIHSCSGLKQLRVTLANDIHLGGPRNIGRDTRQMPSTIETLVLRSPPMEPGAEDDHILSLGHAAREFSALLPCFANNVKLRHVHLARVACDQVDLEILFSTMVSLETIELDCIFFTRHHPVFARSRNTSHPQAYLRLWLDTLDILRNNKQIKDASVVDLNYDECEHNSLWILEAAQDEGSRTLLESAIIDDFGKRNFKWYVINPALYIGSVITDLAL